MRENSSARKLKLTSIQLAVTAYLFRPIALNTYSFYFSLNSLNNLKG